MNQERVFLALVQSGLWGKGIRLSQFGEVDFSIIFNLAEEQSVKGLVAAGFEHVEDIQLMKADAIPFLKSVVQLEQGNAAMNTYIRELVRLFKDASLSLVLLKGQGVAQCYRRPSWRTYGDIDLLFACEDYQKAKDCLDQFGQKRIKEEKSISEYVIRVNNWVIELHGSLHCRLTRRLDAFLDRIQNDICSRGGVRVWNNGGTDVLLPSVNNDVFVIFSHIVKHFFREGIGLRQICDWCRLMWTYRMEIDVNLLEERLNEAGLMSEWKAFAALAVDWLGMPVEAMPGYSPRRKWSRKASHIMAFIWETGNLGHNRDFSYHEKYPFFVRKTISLWRHNWDLIRQFYVFPIDSIRVWCSMIRIGVRAIVQGDQSKGK